MPTFRELGVPAELADVLAASGKTDAFPIQTETLPDSLAGRDVLGRGRTGSGKTIAFALPLVARIAASASPRSAGRPRGLVLAPTRELATQIAATVEPLANAVGLRVTTIFGGVSQRPQEQALRSGADIVVACPGRLEDLMSQKIVSLDRVEVAVLDEADHMADLGFLPGVKRILAATPTDGQRLLFSATLDGGIDVIARRFLSNPVSHEIDESSVPAGEMTHRVFLVADADARTELVRTLASGVGRRILFTRTKHQAKKLAKQLTAAGIPAVDLHGNLSQNARDRNLAAFSAAVEDGGVRVLVATDVAARGVHVDAVELVVHVEPPVEHKAYLHRSGRTARAGAEGTVVTVALADQRREVAGLLKKAGIQVELETVSARDAAVAELVGEVAPVRMPDPNAPTAGGRGGSAPRQAGNAGTRRGSGNGRGQGAASTGGTRSNAAAGGGARRGETAGARRTEGGGARRAEGGGARRAGTGAAGSVYSTSSGAPARAPRPAEGQSDAPARRRRRGSRGRGPAQGAATQR